MHFKESLPPIRRNDLNNLKECLVTEINVRKEKIFSQAYVGPQVIIKGS